MSLVTTLKEIDQTKDQQLNPYDPTRPIMIDGSLSELITQALNIAYSKKNMTTGDPYFGHANENGNPPPGAGGIPNIEQPDSPRAPRPTLEAMQQMLHQQATELASVLEGAFDKNHSDDVEINNNPLMIYALPQDNKITQEMNDDIDAYKQCGVDPNDFIFIYTDDNDVTQAKERVVDASVVVKDYEQKGAKVFPDIQSFKAALPELRKKYR